MSKIEDVDEQQTKADPRKLRKDAESVEEVAKSDLPTEDQQQKVVDTTNAAGEDREEQF
jgi:hypothetical protein